MRKEIHEPTLEEPFYSKWEFLPSVVLFREGHPILGSLIIGAILLYAAILFALGGDKWTILIMGILWIVSLGMGVEFRKKRLRDERDQKKANGPGETNSG